MNRREAEARRAAAGKRRELQSRIQQELFSLCGKVMDEYRRLVQLLSSASSTRTRVDHAGAGAASGPAVTYTASLGAQGQDELTLGDEVRLLLPKSIAQAPASITAHCPRAMGQNVCCVPIK